jgi:hypothetical protein
MLLLAGNILLQIGLAPSQTKALPCNKWLVHALTPANELVRQCQVGQSHQAKCLKLLPNPSKHLTMQWLKGFRKVNTLDALNKLRKGNMG